MCCIRDVETSLAEKEREGIISAQELWDKLLGHLETNTPTKQLEEQVHCLEVENTRLEATVQQNNAMTEALQGDLQATASVDEPSQQLHMECKKCMQLEAHNRDLQEELSTLYAKCEKLKIKCQLKEAKPKLNLETLRVHAPRGGVALHLPS